MSTKRTKANVEAEEQIIFTKSKDYLSCYSNRTAVVSTDWDIYIAFYQAVETDVQLDPTLTKSQLEERARVVMTRENFVNLYNTMTQVMHTDERLKRSTKPLAASFGPPLKS